MTVAPRPARWPAAHVAQLRQALARGNGCKPAEVDLRETHISWVFLAGDRAFKLKKPLRLAFLDYGTPEQRRAMCQQEVQLNARLAPDIYLRVRGVAAQGSELVITEADDPTAIDYLVEMRRYDEQATLAARVPAGHVRRAQIDVVGRLLAGFHVGCPPTPVANGARLARREVDDNLRELADHLTGPGQRRRLSALARCLGHVLTGRRRLFDERGRAGWIREGHGDLRCEHVVLAPRLQVVDCVEFSRPLRTVDTADDLAFLVMDLYRLGSEPTALRLVAAYRGAGGDCGPDQLLWFYAAHRALVRAKVAAIRGRQLAGQADGSPAAAELLSVAERCAWRAREPGVIVVCGVPASGKSHLAGAISEHAGVPVLGTDVVRKQLAGLRPSERAPTSLYTPTVSLRTYRRLGALTARATTHGCSPIIDGTFRRRADREAFRDGLGQSGPVCFVQCTAPDAVLDQRAAARDADPDRVSDADSEVVRRQRHAFEPLDRADADAHIILRTDRQTPDIVDDLLALLDQRALHAPTC